MEEEFEDKFNNTIKLTDKQWSHVIKEHPEVWDYKNRLSDVLTRPDLVKRSKRDKDTYLYYKQIRDLLYRKSMRFSCTATIKIYTKVNIY